MDEAVLAAVIRLDEAIALVFVEKLHGSDSHGRFLSRNGVTADKDAGGVVRLVVT